MNLSSGFRSIKSRINALERKMARALAQVKLERQSNELCEEWNCAQIEQQPLPDPQRLLKNLLPFPPVTPAF